MRKMRKTTFLFLFAMSATAVFAQSMGIGGIFVPDSSSVLQVKASNNDKGILIPELTADQRDAISLPANGLLIYNTTENCVNTYNGTKWISLCIPLVTNGLSLTTVNDSVQLGGTLTQNTDINLNSNNLIFSNSGNVGIGTATPHAKLHLKDESNDPFIIDSLKFTSNPPHSVNDSIYYNLQISNGGVVRKSPVVNHLSEKYIYTLSPQITVAAGDNLGNNGSQLKWIKNGVTYDYITLPEDGAYVFNFRLYGTTTGTTYPANSFYLTAFSGSLSGKLEDSQEIIISTPFTGSTGYQKVTYSATLTLAGKALSKIYFKIAELQDTHQLNWTLLGVPNNGITESSANRTSLIFWKI